MPEYVGRAEAIAEVLADEAEYEGAVWLEAT
jgi:hypothetical protein